MSYIWAREFRPVRLSWYARTARRNESLERGHTNWTKKRGGFFLGGAEVEVKPWADDETYARRYHAAFKKPDTKDE